MRVYDRHESACDHLKSTRVLHRSLLRNPAIGQNPCCKAPPSGKHVLEPVTRFGIPRHLYPQFKSGHGVFASRCSPGVHYSQHSHVKHFGECGELDQILQEAPYAVADPRGSTPTQAIVARSHASRACICPPVLHVYCCAPPEFSANQHGEAERQCHALPSPPSQMITGPCTLLVSNAAILVCCQVMRVYAHGS